MKNLLKKSGCNKKYFKGMRKISWLHRNFIIKRVFEEKSNFHEIWNKILVEFKDNFEKCEKCDDSIGIVEK